MKILQKIVSFLKAGKVKKAAWLTFHRASASSGAPFI
jgi:hypothetical protein